MTFFAIPECLKTDRFQNTRFQHILEPLMISLSGMAHIFAFQNHKNVLLKEHTSFLKHEKLGVLESLFLAIPEWQKKMDFRTKNVLQMTFLSHSGTQKKMAIPEPQTATTFRKALKKGFSERIFCQMF